MSKIGLTALGAYIPYYYMKSSVIADAWGEKPGKTQRSICNSDEDAVTMAVESSMDCLRYIDKSKIQGLNMATTTGPYAEKSHATLVSTVLDLNPEINVTDYNSSLRSGTAALRNAYAHVKSELATSDIKNNIV